MTTPRTEADLPITLEGRGLLRWLANAFVDEPDREAVRKSILAIEAEAAAQAVAAYAEQKRGEVVRVAAEHWSQGEEEMWVPAAAVLALLAVPDKGEAGPTNDGTRYGNWYGFDPDGSQP